MAQFVKTTENLGFQHHGRALRISPGVAPQLLLARFALLVLGRLTKFLSYYRDKGVMAIVVEGDTRPEPKVVPLTGNLVDAVFSQRNCANLNTPQSRKRVRRETPQEPPPDSRSPPAPAASSADDGGGDDNVDDGVSAAKLDSRFFGGPPPLPAVDNANNATVAAMYGTAPGPSNFVVEPFHLPLEGNDRSPYSGRPAKRRRGSSSCSSAEAWAKGALVDIGEVTRKLGYLKRAQKLNELMGWI